MDALEKEARIFKTLGHPARLAILNALRGDEQCVCHLECILGMRQAYLSQQLAVLKEAGLIHDRRDGWNIFYFVSRPEILPIVDGVWSMLGVSEKPMAGRAARPARCPCPKCRTEKVRNTA